MTAWRRAIELSIGEDHLATLVSITRVRELNLRAVLSGHDIAGLSERPVLLCGGALLGGPSSDGPALR